MVQLLLALHIADGVLGHLHANETLESTLIVFVIFFCAYDRILIKIEE